MNTIHRSRKLLVRSALASSSTIAVLIGAQALMMQDAQTDSNTVDAAIEQTGQVGQTEQIEPLNNTATTDAGSSTTTIRSGSVTPSQSFPQRTRTSR